MSIKYYSFDFIIQQMNAIYKKLISFRLLLIKLLQVKYRFRPLMIVHNCYDESNITNSISSYLKPNLLSQNECQALMQI
jgi:hypothetical protein